MKAWLKREWINLSYGHTQDQELVSKYWDEIVKHYTSTGRHYHNLSHIYNMLLQAEAIKSNIDDYDTLRFSIWYHDIIYKSPNKDNEIKSAKLSKKRLETFDFNQKRIEIVEKLIISTQKHTIISNENNDNAYLLDIDLSILGTNWNGYQNYIQNIRKEYAIYPEFMFKKGRRKAMQHFLERDTIYVTKSYKAKYENQARLNIEREISNL